MKLPSYLKSTTNLVFLILVVAAVIFTGKGTLDPKDFMTLVMSAAAFKFGKKSV